MKKERLKERKPINKIHKDLPYKGCTISYSVFDYGLGSSGFAYIRYFTKNETVVACVTLDEAFETIKKTESEIIKRAKNWINTRVSVKR